MTLNQVLNSPWHGYLQWLRSHPRRTEKDDFVRWKRGHDFPPPFQLLPSHKWLTESWEGRLIQQILDASSFFACFERRLPKVKQLKLRAPGKGPILALPKRFFLFIYICPAVANTQLCSSVIAKLCDATCSWKNGEWAIINPFTELLKANYGGLLHLWMSHCQCSL